MVGCFDIRQGPPGVRLWRGVAICETHSATGPARFLGGGAGAVPGRRPLSWGRRSQMVVGGIESGPQVSAAMIDLDQGWEAVQMQRGSRRFPAAAAPAAYAVD